MELVSVKEEPRIETGEEEQWGVWNCGSQVRDLSTPQGIKIKDEPPDSGPLVNADGFAGETSSHLIKEEIQQDPLFTGEESNAVHVSAESFIKTEQLSECSDDGTENVCGETEGVGDNGGDTAAAARLDNIVTRIHWQNIENQLSMLRGGNKPNNVEEAYASSSRYSAMRGSDDSDDKIYQCYHCTYRARLKEYLKKHIESVHLEIKPHSCDMCELKFNLKTTLSRHTLAVHHGIKPYFCKLCDFNSSYKGAIRKHVLVIHRGVKPFACNLCNFRSIEKFSLTQHVQAVHNGVKPYACSMCDYRASYTSAIKSHVLNIHERRKSHSCHLCDYKANRAFDIKKHVQAVHEGVKPFACKICDFKGSEKGALVKHLKAVHLRIKPYSCEQCDYRASQKHHVKLHVRAVHEGLRPFACTICDYRAAERRTLTRHIDLIHNKPHLCDICQSTETTHTQCKTESDVS